MSLRVCRANERFDLCRVLEKLFFAQVKQDVHTANREVHPIQGEPRRVRKHVYALRVRGFSQHVAVMRRLKMQIRTGYGGKDWSSG